MTSDRRLKAVVALLAGAAIISTAHVWGDGQKKRAAKPSAGVDAAVLYEQDKLFSDDLTDSKFGKGALVTYRTSSGDTLFALQIKPNISAEAASARACDYLCIIDTSASQAQGPLAGAVSIVETFAKSLKPSDRMSVWTLNIPQATKCITHGFKDAASSEVQKAIADLKLEVPMGDTDLKLGLNKAIASFEPDSGRNRALIFLGDGMSIHNPLDNDDRAGICQSMIQAGINFYSIPLGPRLDSANLHTLATGSGGTVVRALAKDTPADTVRNLQTVLASPIYYPSGYKLGPDVVQSFPTVLPPLRADEPTLVVGRMKSDGPVSFELDGTVAGRNVHLSGNETVADSSPDNFFLVGMFEQWKGHKDLPASNRADRVLAYAYQQNQMTRATLLAEAEWAIRHDRLEAAKGLFEQTRKLDPNDIESAAGLKLVDKLHAGLLKMDELKKQLKTSRPGDNALAQAAEKASQPTPLAPATNPQTLLQEQKDRAAVEEQRVTRIVDEAQRQARQLLQVDPDAARELLKRTYAAVRDNPDLSEKAHQQLSARLETSLRSVEVLGTRIRRDRQEELRNLADSKRRLDLEQTRVAEEERVAKRLERFSQLMDQARYEDAYRLANAIRVDAINTGRPVPKEAIIAYGLAINENNLTQVQEIRRRCEERWLQVLLEVEHSHLPFPDEPPVRFPDGKFWREITRVRKERYEESGFTEDDPVTRRKAREMKAKLSQVVDLKNGIESMPLRDALENLQDLYQVTILTDSQAFKTDLSEDEIETHSVKLPKMTGVTLATVLRLLTGQINGTYLVRKDFIEITTGTRALVDKVIRVYPVADLVIPIPNGYNRNAVQQSLSILGTAPGLGLNLGSPAALQNIGQGVGLGAGLGALGAGLGFGGGGGLGFGGGAGGGGGGLGGALGGQLGIGAGGQVNLGVGGGQLGFGGGQLGQLGNLGGQFGLQGGDQSAILVSLIKDVVGTPKDWGRVNIFQRAEALGRQGGVNPAAQDNGDEDTDRLPADQINNLGYYPPARALVVKGTSRFHFGTGGGTIGSGRGGMAKANGPQNNDVADLLKQIRPGGAKLAKADDKKKAPAEEPDPKKIWQEALAKGVNDPGLIIAVADFLAQCGRYDHVVEFLKADLRQGIVVAPWVYDALAIALEASKGAPEEIERARVSAVDLEPQDARGYVRASKALGDLQQYDRAVALCRQASVLDPSDSYSYEEGLIYAELAQDPQAMQWAAGNLLKQDWPTENKELHAKARTKLEALADTLSKSQRRGEAERMLKNASSLGERDLVVQLSWQGDADLDLEVKEPTGAACSFLQRQTTGGGTLIGDTLADSGRETYVAASAFPGEYQVKIRRIWGRPLGGKATVEIIEHQGTPQEARRRETIAFDREYVVPVTLENGRRTEEAYVSAQPPPRKVPAAAPRSSTAVANKLRMIADPDKSDLDTHMQTGLVTLGAATDDDAATTSVAKVGATAGNVRAGDDSPVFLNSNRSTAPVRNPYLPGGG
jgi:tetratricopeptide (TPR) repeat protein